MPLYGNYIKIIILDKCDKKLLSKVNKKYNKIKINKIFQNSYKLFKQAYVVKNVTSMLNALIKYWYDVIFV